MYDFEQGIRLNIKTRYEDNYVLRGCTLEVVDQNGDVVYKEIPLQEITIEELFLKVISLLGYKVFEYVELFSDYPLNEVEYNE